MRFNPSCVDALQEHPLLPIFATDLHAGGAVDPHERRDVGGRTPLLARRRVAEHLVSGGQAQMVNNQAREMAYLDAFWIFWVMALAALPLVLLMRKSVSRGAAAMH
jgi:hypothetical protein